MSIELQTWSHLGIQTSFSIRLVRYKLIYRSVPLNLQILVSASYELLPPAGLVNSEGFNLFIGNSL